MVVYPFHAVMRQMAAHRRRNGALRWSLTPAGDVPGHYVETFYFQTAAEYNTRQFARTSTGKRAIILIAMRGVNLFLQISSLLARVCADAVQYLRRHVTCRLATGACSVALAWLAGASHPFAGSAVPWGCNRWASSGRVVSA